MKKSHKDRKEVLSENTPLKLMTMHKALDHRDNIDILYVSSKEGGRESASIEDKVHTSKRRHI